MESEDESLASLSKTPLRLVARPLSATVGAQTPTELSSPLPRDYAFAVAGSPLALEPPKVVSRQRAVSPAPLEEPAPARPAEELVPAKRGARLESEGLVRRPAPPPVPLPPRDQLAVAFRPKTPFSAAMGPPKKIATSLAVS